MKVLYLSDVYFPRVNGVSTSIRTFRDELRQQGSDVTLVAPDYGADAADAAEPDLIRLRASRVPFDPEDRRMRGADLRRLLAQLAEKRFDLVHIQTPFVAHRAGIWLARHLGVPAVETYHTHFEEYLGHYVPFAPASWLQALARGLARRQSRALAGLVAPSEPMAETLRGYGVSAPIAVIPTGLPASAFRPGDRQSFRDLHLIGRERPTLLHVGRVAFEKNISFVFRALARVRAEIPDVLLILAGEGPALPSLKQLARELGVDHNILYLGYLDRRSALLDCYAAADAFVFASRTETQGLVLLEAMAMGLPVVSTAVLGTRVLLESGKGALVPEDDLDDFAAKTVRVLRDPALRQRLGAEGRALAREWTSTRMAERMLRFYEQTVADALSPEPPESRAQRAADRSPQSPPSRDPG